MQRSYKNTNKIPTFSYFKDRKIPTFSYFGMKIPTFSYFFDLSYHFQPCICHNYKCGCVCCILRQKDGTDGNAHIGMSTTLPSEIKKDNILCCGGRCVTNQILLCRCKIATLSLLNTCLTFFWTHWYRTIVCFVIIRVSWISTLFSLSFFSNQIGKCLLKD